VIFYSGDCSSPKPFLLPPRALLNDEMLAKFDKPYLGMVQGKVWDNQGIVGRMVGPIEDIYMEFVEHNHQLPKVIT
jgi:hypothetical protein